MRKKIEAALRQNEAKLFKKANVVGIGIGEKIKANQSLKRLCLKVYVEKKLPERRLSKQDLVPQTLSSVETDVEQIGKIYALTSRGYTGRYRPAKGGVSIGHYKITAGTLGGLVKDRKTGKVLILSNNHVLANSNQAKKGDLILQPGPYDNGKNPKDIIARLARWVEIKFSNTGNQIDAALAMPDDPALVSPEIMRIGRPKGIKTVKLGSGIQKSGRTTGYTTGKVKDISATVKINYDRKVALFRNQILTTNISEGGDSGSLVLDMKKYAIGLLFAGSEEVTVVNPIDQVLRQLDVEV